LDPLGIRAARVSWNLSPAELYEEAIRRDEGVIDPVFNVEVPHSCPGVPAEVLTPKGTWSDWAAGLRA
jgi:ATP-dependent phosphoenolpyruvate carboxykinase